MSDIYETRQAYDAACEERGIRSHPMIQAVLTVDEEENTMWVDFELYSYFMWLFGNILL